MSNLKIQDPILRLREDHDRVLDVMDAIEQAVGELQGPVSPAALQLIRDALAFMERDVRAHAQIEELVLYPAFLRHLPPLTIETLTEEHSDIWWAMDLLREGLRDERQLRIAELRWHATSLVDLVRRHIERESNVLLTIAAQLLSDPEYEALVRAMHDFLLQRDR